MHPSVVMMRRLAEMPRRLVESVRGLTRRRDWLYSDDIVKLDEERIVVRRYYWPFGSKRIRYSKIRRVRPRPLKAWHGQYRVQGIDFRRRWYSRDRHRGERETAIDLSIGNILRPSITPEDPVLVLEILQRMAPNAFEVDSEA